MSKETNCRNIRNNKHEIQTEKRTVGSARSMDMGGEPTSSEQETLAMDEGTISALMYHGHVALQNIPLQLLQCVHLDKFFATSEFDPSTTIEPFVPAANSAAECPAPQTGASLGVYPTVPYRDTSGLIKQRSRRSQGCLRNSMSTASNKGIDDTDMSGVIQCGSIDRSRECASVKYEKQLRPKGLQM
ncbi:hypothetical protein IW261DRAFT_1416359 [Armillaria novae-zelandiae]|uniref:Uncharacterized protein n=1 Tax=Armillaria novae-zelandiae TaxID=153914 RepID=A0AA39PMJ4_9AGAR|nr:hypothetical protein IW261DRAFT_1416359 [Armillaria novae-zelandiae]